jgi:hypothetical protein
MQDLDAKGAALEARLAELTKDREEIASRVDEDV